MKGKKSELKTRNQIVFQSHSFRMKCQISLFSHFNFIIHITDTTFLID